MVFDFSKICKTYDAKIYKKSDFLSTRCPKCPAVGRFNLHGSYCRYVLYFVNHDLMHEYIEIKRIKCLSCKTTHAVMPGDMIPYKLLSLMIVLFILNSYYVADVPVLKIADEWDFSFQLIYLVLFTFKRHVYVIYQFFRESLHDALQPNLGDADTISLIEKPYAKFQSRYIKFIKRPCFMCKFFNSPNAPPIGQMPLSLPLQGQQHNL